MVLSKIIFCLLRINLPTLRCEPISCPAVSLTGAEAKLYGLGIGRLLSSVGFVLLF